jgi:hypothetical protein
MAEAFAAIGAITAIGTLISDFARLNKRLNYYIKHIKHAPTEIQEVDLEVTHFSILLRAFEKSINSLKSKNIRFVEAAIDADLPIILSQHSKLVLDGADRLLRSLKPLRDDTGSSTAAKLLARLSWAMKKVEVEPLKITLISIKSSMHLFCSMLQISEMRNEIEIRRQKGDEISELLRQL